MINAVTLVTADMARSHAFYAALGFDRMLGGPEATFTTYRVGQGFLNIQLDPAHAPVPAIWGRVIFWVADVDVMHGMARPTATSRRWRRPMPRGASGTSTSSTPTATS